MDKNVKEAPDAPEYLEIHFERGVPVALNDEEDGWGYPYQYVECAWRKATVSDALIIWKTGL